MTSQSSRPARFAVGDKVRVDDRAAIGHCRTPSFIRGRTGTVAFIHGAFRDPERLAYHRPGLPALVLYKVRFQQTDIWPDYAGSKNDQLEVDVYDNWLTPADS